MTAPEPDSTFAPGVKAWSQGLGRVRDAVRQELVARQLSAHLPPLTGDVRPTVLDVGCGQATQAIRLARHGYDVTGVDVSQELLALAESAASQEPTTVSDRLRFQHADLLALGQEFAERFDVACCHGVLMYVPSLEEATAALVRTVRPGGLLSILTRNRFGIAMRAGMSGDWAGAVAGFDARRYRNRVGIEAVRADEPDEVEQALRAAGAERISWYGVRLFSDHWETVAVPEDFTDLVAAEEEAGRRDPYRAVAALTHTLAVRTPTARTPAVRAPDGDSRPPAGAP